MRRSEPGWYPDPLAPGALRYWDGQNWTQHVAFQGRQFTSPVSIAEVTAASDAADADVVRNYVVDARRRGVIDEQAAHSLNVDLGRMLQRGLPPPTPVPSASPVPTKAPPAVAHRQPEGRPPSVVTHEAAPAAGSASASAAAGTTAVRTEPRLVQRWPGSGRWRFSLRRWWNRAGALPVDSSRRWRRRRSTGNARAAPTCGAPRTPNRGHEASRAAA